MIILTLFIIIIIVVAYLVYNFYINRDEVEVKKYADNTEFLRIIAIILFGSLIPMLSRKYFSDYNYSVTKTQKTIGYILLILSFILFVSSLYALNKNYSPTLIVKKDQELITGGIYKYIRHPIYAGALVLFISSIFLSPNKIGTISSLLALLILLSRIPYEEKMMSDMFDRDYIDYIKKTDSLIPGIL